MAAGNTYTPIATTTLTTTTSSVTFGTGSPLSGNIPQNYTDLVVVISGTSTSSPGAFKWRYNSDSTALYSDTLLFGSNNSGSQLPYSVRASNQTFLDSTNYAVLDTTTPGTFIMHIMNYSNTTTYKTALVRSNIPTNTTSLNEVGLIAALYRSTNPITSINLNTSSSTWAIGSTFTLYGIAAA